MRDMGKAWVVIEESFHAREKKLVSIISPRRSVKFVADYVEQVYVDRFASTAEKISFKKNKNSSPYRIEPGMVGDTTIRCGHEPMLNAYFAHKLVLRGNQLNFHYSMPREGRNRLGEEIFCETVECE